MNVASQTGDGSAAILRRWILKILPDRNCSTGEGAETERSFAKSSGSTGSRKKCQISLAKAASEL